MLPADQLELITAAVDGELSATEARAFRRLLDVSHEARALYAKLLADSVRVRALPRATPPADLRTKILNRIATATPKPRTRPARSAPRFAPEPVRRKLPAWVPAALAASVLLSVTAGSFAFFHRSNPQPIAKNPWSNALPVIQDTVPTVPSPTATAHQNSTQRDPSSVARLDVSPVPPSPPPRAVVPDALATAPEPRSVLPPDLIGSKILEPLAPFEFVQVRVPFLRTVAELDRDDTRQELADELARDSAFRFDLFVRDTARGVEVFQNAARAAGLTLFADATTLERLKKKQVASVVIYTESLNAAELSALFAKLTAEDMKFSPRVCDSLHATPIVRSDELELKAILGVDVGVFKRPAGTGAGQGERGEKPVSAGTIESVSKSLTSSPAKPGDHTAVLMTWQPAHPMLGRTPPNTSAELKKYLEKRGPRKPNAIPAVIVIRSLG